MRCSKAAALAAAAALAMTRAPGSNRSLSVLASPARPGARRWSSVAGSSARRATWTARTCGREALATGVTARRRWRRSAVDHEERGLGRGGRELELAGDLDPAGGGRLGDRGGGDQLGSEHAARCWPATSPRSSGCRWRSRPARRALARPWISRTPCSRWRWPRSTAAGARAARRSRRPRWRWRPARPGARRWVLAGDQLGGGGGGDQLGPEVTRSPATSPRPRTSTPSTGGTVARPRSWNCTGSPARRQWRRQAGGPEKHHQRAGRPGRRQALQELGLVAVGANWMAPAGARPRGPGRRARAAVERSAPASPARPAATARARAGHLLGGDRAGGAGDQLGPELEALDREARRAGGGAPAGPP